MSQNQFYTDSSFFVSDDNLNFHSSAYSNYDQNFDSYSQPAQLNPSSPWQQPATNFTGEEDEPPLLEELGIDVNKIFTRLLHSLDPTGRCGVILGDYDVIGPIALYLTYTSLLLLAGGKLMFSYVYGLAVLTSVCMYALLWAMTDSSEVTLTSTFSVLGYSFTPVVLVALLAVFVNLKNVFGALIVFVAVLWSSSNAAKVFVAMFGNADQKYLMAYPCAIICGLYTLFILY
ncbi:protein YIPF5-like [Adelges cooleyi]|uniref:protein YIPF5-like n=1 Tax=Adelges cooleyi TaxID=133065 RepID=UPI00217F4D3C|nr:protein YIPF5-like [Adelges cooleyi]